MRVYIVKYEKKGGGDLQKVVLKLTNDLTGEEIFYSGFLNEMNEIRTWGKSGWLESYAELRKDKPLENKK